MFHGCSSCTRENYVLNACYNALTFLSICSFVRVTCKGVGKTTATSAGYTTCILATQLQAMGIACSHIVANSPILGVRCRAERNEIWYT